MPSRYPRRGPLPVTLRRRVWVPSKAIGATAYTQTNSGTLTTSGVLKKDVTHFKAGTLGLGGSVSNAGPGGVDYTQNVAGTLTTSGVLTKGPTKFPRGTITPAGVVKKDVSHFKAGTLTTAGVLAKRVNKFLAGVLTLAGQGDYAQAGQPTQFTQSLAGGLTFSGVLSNVVVTPVEAVAPFLHRDVRGSPFAYRMVYPMGRGRR